MSKPYVHLVAFGFILAGVLIIGAVLGLAAGGQQ